MARPITWESIRAPDFSSASRILGQAQQSLQAGLKGAGDIVNDISDIRQENTDVRSREFLDTVRGEFDTSAKLNAAIDSGELAELQSGAGKLNNSIVNNKAFAKLDSSLRKQQIADDNFAEHELKQNTSDLRDQFLGNMASGDFAANEELAKNNKLYNEGELLLRNSKASKVANREQERLDDRRQRQEDRVRRLGIEAQQRRRQNKYDARADAEYAREEAKRVNLETYGTMVTEKLAFIDSSKQQQKIAEESFLSEMFDKDGFTMEQISNPEWLNQQDSDTLNKVEHYKAKYNSIYQKLPNATQHKKELMRQLLDTGASSKDALDFANYFDSNVVESNKVSQVESQQFASERAVIESNPDFRSSTVVSQLKNPKSPVQMAQDIRKSISKDTWDKLGANDAGEIDKFLSEVMSGGVDYIGLDGKTRKMPLTEPMIKEVIDRMPNKSSHLFGTINFDRSVDNVLNELIEGGAFASDFEAGVQYQNQITALNMKANALTANTKGTNTKFNSIDLTSARQRANSRRTEKEDRFTKQFDRQVAAEEARIERKLEEENKVPNRGWFKANGINPTTSTRNPITGQ